MAEFKQTKLGHRNIDFMTIPQIKNSKKIVSQKLKETKDPLLQRKLENMLFDFEKKERAINKFYQKCASSKNPNISSMIRGRKLLLRFVDVKRLNKNGTWKNLTFKTKKEKADYNAVDLMRDIRADKIAMGIGVASMGMGVASIKFGEQSLMEIVKAAINDFITANPVAFGFLAGGAALIAASKIIPAIDKKIRKVKHHASAIRAVENQISEEQLKEEAGFDHSALSSSNFAKSKEKIVNDLFNHPNLKNYYEKALLEKNSPLTTGQKLNLITALKEANYKLEDLKRVQEGKPTQAQEAAAKQAQIQDEQTYNQVKTEIENFKETLDKLNDNSAMEEISSLENQIKNIGNLVSQIKNNDLKNELVPSLKEIQNDFNSKSQTILKIKEQAEANVAKEIENEINEVSTFIDNINSKTPKDEISGLKTKISNLQNKINALHFSKFKTKLNASLNSVNEKYNKLEAPKNEKKKGKKKENTLQIDISTQNFYNNEIPKIESKINELSSKSEEKDFAEITNFIDKFKTDAENIHDAEIKTELLEKYEKLNQTFESKKKEISSYENTNSAEAKKAEEITNNLKSFEADLPKVNASNLQAYKNKLSAIKADIEKITDSVLKTNLTSNYKAVESAFADKEKSIGKENTFENLNNELNQISNTIDNLTKDDLITIAEKFEALEHDIYKTNDKELIDKFVELENKYLVKRTELKGQKLDNSLESLNNDFSSVRQQIESITFENYETLEIQIQASIADLQIKVENVPTTKTHFQERLKHVEIDFKDAIQAAKDKAADKAKNQSNHKLIDELDNLMSGLDTLTLAEFDSRVILINQRIDEIKKEITSTKSKSNKHALNRLNSFIAEKDKIVEKNKSIRLNNEKIAAEVKIKIANLKSSVNLLDFKNAAAKTSFTTQIKVTHDSINKIEKNPVLAKELRDEVNNATKEYTSRLDNAEKATTFKGSMFLVSKIQEIDNHMNSIKEFDDKTIASFETRIKEVENSLSTPPTPLVKNLLEKLKAKLKDKASQQAKHNSEIATKTLNSNFETLFKLIGDLGKADNHAQVEELMKIIETDISKLTSGKDYFTSRLEDSKEYYSKKKMQINDNMASHEIHLAFNEIDRLTSKLKWQNYESNTNEIEGLFNKINKIMSENSITDTKTKERLARTQKRYTDRKIVAEKDLEANAQNNAKIEAEVKTQISETTTLVDSINPENFESLKTTYHQQIKNIGDNISKILGNKSLRNSLLNSKDALVKKFDAKESQYESSKKENEALKAQQTQLENLISEIEADIVNLTKASGQEIHQVEDKIKKLETLKDNPDVNEQFNSKIDESSKNLQAKLAKKQEFLKKQAKLKENSNKVSSIEQEIQTELNKISKLIEKLDLSKLEADLIKNIVSSYEQNIVLSISSVKNKISQNMESLGKEKADKYYNDAENFLTALNEKTSEVHSKTNLKASDSKFSSKISNFTAKYRSEISPANVERISVKFLAEFSELEKEGQSLNNPEINRMLKNTKEELQEFIQARKEDSAKRKSTENAHAKFRETGNIEASSKKETYQIALKDAAKNYIDSQGFATARIKTETQKNDSLATITAYIAKKLYITEAEAKKLINSETGDYMPTEYALKHLNPDNDPQFKELLNKCKKASMINSRIKEKEVSTNTEILENNHRNTRLRLVHKIKNLLKIDLAEAEKLVDANGNLIGEAAYNEKITTNRQVINMCNNVKASFELLNKYKNASPAEKENMSPTVLRSISNEIARVDRNMRNNLSPEEYQQAHKSICADLKIDLEEFNEIVNSGKINTNEAELDSDDPIVHSKQAKKDSNEETVEEHVENDKSEHVVEETPVKPLDDYRKEIKHAQKEYFELKQQANPSPEVASLLEEKSIALSTILAAAINDYGKDKIAIVKAETEAEVLKELNVSKKAPSKSEEKEVVNTIEDYEVTINEIVVEYENAKKSFAPENVLTEKRKNIYEFIQYAEDDHGKEAVKHIRASVGQKLKKINETVYEKPVSQEVPQEDTFEEEVIENSGNMSVSMSLEECIEEINERVETYKKAKAANEKATMDKCKEKIKQVCKYAKKAHSKDAIAFLQEDVYREIYLGEEVKEDEKVTNLKQAINNVDQKTYEFKELISSLSKLYNNSSKIEHDTKTFNALMDKISSLPVKEQYIAKGLMKASQIAVEKTQNAQEEQLQSSNENIQKPDILYRNKIIEFGNSGLSAEDIVKALNLNPNKTKEIEEILIENQKSLVAKNKNNIIDLGNNGLSAEEIAKKLKLDPITKKDIQKILNENVKTME